MLKINFSQDALRFLKKLSSQDYNVILGKIDMLSRNSKAFSSKALIGYKPLRRVRSGDFRIIYHIENSILYVSFIGKRNDGEVYKKLARKK